MSKEIAVLVGKTLKEVRRDTYSYYKSERERDKDNALLFVLDDGQEYLLAHQQDCCEQVYLEDINGDLEDLVGTPIVEAYMESNDEAPIGWVPPEYTDDAQEWSFYRLRTIKGTVTLRWYGQSNGYYSTSVDFFRKEN